MSGVLPLVGLGTFQARYLAAEGDDEATEAFVSAARVGYRMFDSAALYGTEKPLGDALKVIALPRDEVQIVTKLRLIDMRRDFVKLAIDESLSNLGIDFIDLLYIHWPIAFKRNESLDNFPIDEAAGGRYLYEDDYDYLETYKAMEDFGIKSGKVKHLGLSNFNEQQVARVLARCEIRPACLQIESHVYHQDSELVAFAQSKSIQVVAYSPLGKGTTGAGNAAIINAEAAKLNVFEDETLKRIAAKHGKTVAQVALRFQTQRGVVVIPKSASENRQKENLACQSFTLDEDDLKQIRALDKKARIVTFSKARDYKFYPF